jgi:hypothetical protein
MMIAARDEGQFINESFIWFEIAICNVFDNCVFFIPFWGIDF